LGIPIIPPTPELVGEMLKATSRRPEEVVWTGATEDGVLTIELVATHAVMAGCKPSYMPLSISALEAFLDPIANWRGITTTTAQARPWLL